MYFFLSFNESSYILKCVIGRVIISVFFNWNVLTESVVSEFSLFFVSGTVISVFSLFSLFSVLGTATSVFSLFSIC